MGSSAPKRVAGHRFRHTRRAGAPERARDIDAQTLDALSSAGSRPGEPRPGRLTEELQPLGFDAFAGRRSPAKRETERDAAAQAAAAKRAAAAAAKREAAERTEAAKARLREAHALLDRAKDARATAALRLKEADARVDEALRQVEEAKNGRRKGSRTE